MFYFVLDIARKFHLLPASRKKLATRRTEPLSYDFAPGELGSEEPSWPSDMMRFDGCPCSGTFNGPMTLPAQQAAQTTIAGGNYTRPSNMSYSEAAGQQGGQPLRPVTHPAMCRYPLGEGPSH